MNRFTLGRKRYNMSIDILVVALTAYFALSLGITQTRNISTPFENSELSIRKSVVI